MSISVRLSDFEKSLEEKDERSYFWTHQVRYEYILRKVEKISNSKRLTILDIGCFPYHVGRMLEDFGHAVYGISSYHEPVKNKKIVVLNIENEKFPFKDNFFDLVLCNEVIEHLPQSPIVALQEMFRVTKKKGFCIITTPNITRSINRGKMVFGKSVMYPIEVYFEEDGKGNNIYHRHNREYTLQELAALMKKTSWKIEESHYFISYTPFRKREKPDNLIVFLGKCVNYFFMIVIPFWRDTLFVLGRKS